MNLFDDIFLLEAVPSYGFLPNCLARDEKKEASGPLALASTGSASAKCFASFVSAKYRCIVNSGEEVREHLMLSDRQIITLQTNKLRAMLFGFSDSLCKRFLVGLRVGVPTLLH